MEQTTGPPRPTLEQLRYVAQHFPIIDSHANNLILPSHADSVPFESITTEAQGRALRDTFKSLPHLRAARQLRQLYECDEDANWDEILEQRTEWCRSDPKKLHRRCFEGIHAVLMDDGLAEPQKVYPFDFHDEYFQAPSKRIVRIETVAERLMERIVRDADEDDLARGKFLPDIFIEFMDGFERLIQDAVKDPEVAGFKTVICYRTGLDIEPDYEEAARLVGHPFERYVKACIRKRTYRIERKPLNDYLVLRTLEILSERLPKAESFSKPLQLHTGLGDNDIDLRKSNPAYLQHIIEAYPSVPFVLLHSAYPYTQEAGYLATVYRHVYLDVGEVFPMVSREGQMSVLRQALELTPGSKLLYSSDGHWFPETYYLANLQFREVWLELLLELVEKRDLTTFQAIAMTKDILFNNSNVLYSLRYQAKFDEPPAQEAPKQLTYNPGPMTDSPQLSPGMPPIPPAGVTTQPAPSGPVDPRSGSPYSPPTFPPPPTSAQAYETKVFDDFIKQHPDTRFVYVEWLDYISIIRTRILSIKEFARMIREGDRISISQDDTGIPQNETSPNAANTRGDIYIEPDLRSLRASHNKDPLKAATVLSYWRTEDGSPLPTCPRTSLETLVNNLQYTHASTLLIAFEITVTFLTRGPANPSSTKPEALFTPLPTTSSDPLSQIPFLAAILTALDDSITQFYTTTSAPGTYTFTLPPLAPLLAIDTLLSARQTISQIAAQHGIRATLTGSLAHTQISLNPPDSDMSFFVGGVLAHLEGLCAFSMADTASYPREGKWEHVTWTSQNRSNVPLRRVKDGRWEVRCIDGLANPYFALSAIIAAGLLGLQSGEDGQEYVKPDGVGRKMPGSWGEAVEALKADGALREVLEQEVVGGWMGAKSADVRVLGSMGEGEGRGWMVGRY